MSHGIAYPAAVLLLANLLLAIAAFGLLSIATSRFGPEGPVGAHMITLPLALLQAAALALVFHRGHLAHVPLPAPVFYLLLLGLVMAMTVLPLSGGRSSTSWARTGTLLSLAGAFAVVDGPLVPGRVVESVGGIVVGLVALGGWTLLGALVLESQRNAVRRAAADEQRMTEFEANQRAFDLGEFAKLPAQAELWQLIQFTHSFHPDVQRQCRERIAALPDLQQAMADLLGTGWAEHALRYLDDCWPLPYAPLAPAFGAFLDQERERWADRLIEDHNGSWGANVSRHFAVAEKIQKGGGDLQPQLRRWLAVLDKARGHRGLAAFVRTLVR